MTANPWTKFFWNDWDNDPAIRLCSLSAQGLWMRLLCICAKSDPVGYVTVEGNALTHDDLSLLIGRPASEIVPLLDELSSRGVLSRDGKGRIYNRRMVRDARNHVTAQRNGKLGGNPSLSIGKENSVPLNPPDKPPDKPHSHKPIAITISQPTTVPSTARARLADEIWRKEELPSHWQDYAEEKDVPNEQIFKSWKKFKETTTFPYALSRWRGWIDRERKVRAA